MKDAIVAKVAAQAADYYQDAYRLATSPMVKSMWDKVFTSLDSVWRPSALGNVTSG